MNHNDMNKVSRGCAESFELHLLEHYGERFNFTFKEAQDITASFLEKHDLKVAERYFKLLVSRVQSILNNWNDFESWRARWEFGLIRWG